MLPLTLTSLRPPPPVQDRSTLENLTAEAAKDLCRNVGLSSTGNKPEVVERIVDARVFAVSLRAKHPSSFERGASGQGGWWGFPGDYGVLQPADLEKEAIFSAVMIKVFNT